MKTNVQYGGATLLNKKAFTLIELLAVIVILAIIALIATPIVLNIINSSRESANKRSVELYGKAVENAIAKAQLTGEIPAGDLSNVTLSNNKKLLDTVQYSGNKVECTINILKEDGTIYLSGCTVNNKTVDYTYGTSQEGNNNQQASLTRYYYFGSGNLSDGIPAGASTNLAEISRDDEYIYLAFDSADGTTIDAAFACYENPYDSSDLPFCLEYGSDSYTSNRTLLQTKYGSHCKDESDSFIECDSNVVDSTGFVRVNSSFICDINENSYYCDK